VAGGDDITYALVPAARASMSIILCSLGVHMARLSSYLDFMAYKSDGKDFYVLQFI
jgi:hypothetical protein